MMVFRMERRCKEECRWFRGGSTTGGLKCVGTQAVLEMEKWQRQLDSYGNVHYLAPEWIDQARQRVKCRSSCTAYWCVPSPFRALDAGTLPVYQPRWNTFYHHKELEWKLRFCSRAATSRTAHTTPPASVSVSQRTLAQMKAPSSSDLGLFSHFDGPVFQSPADDANTFFSHISLSDSIPHVPKRRHKGSVSRGAPHSERRDKDIQVFFEKTS